MTVYCFVVGTKSDISNHVTNSDKVIQAIADICAERGGRCFKGEAKTAKCAILLAPSHRNKTEFEKYKSAGYIVVMPENFLRYFGKAEIYSGAISSEDFSTYIASLQGSGILKPDYSVY